MIETRHLRADKLEMFIKPITDLLHVDGDAFKCLGDVGVVSCGHDSEVVLDVDPDH